MNDGPVYDHDCVRCRYLGTTGPTLGYPKANAVDHYACRGSLIQRGGSNGPNYLCIPVEIIQERPLAPWSVTVELLALAEQNSLALSCA